MDATCEHCERDYCIRDGCDPTPLCDDCAHSEVERLRGVLQAIRDYYSGAGYIGGMADDALKPPNEKLSDPANKKL